MYTVRSVFSDARTWCWDGAYGSLFQSRGMPAGVSPELWGLEQSETVAAVHREYLAAGARILTTNTFGGSQPKLGSKADATALNRAMTAIARKVADERGGFVAGSVGPTGLFVKPLGPLSLKELVEIYKAQIVGLVQGGADIIKAETHFDLAEIRAVVLAVREVCDLPVVASMTFEGPSSLTGTPPEVFVDTLQNMGVDAVGVNCSAGPVEVLATVKAMVPRLEIPLHVQPNAGLPILDESGATVFPLGPQEFAEACRELVLAGAKLVAGCCGTTPEHIRALAGMLEQTPWTPPVVDPGTRPALVLTSRSESVLFGPRHPFVVIGERINPTGKPVLTEELTKGEYAEARRLATEQLARGARVLDVNVGAPMVDETVLLPGLTENLVERTACPLSLDSSLPEAIEEGLWRFPGSALVNSISAEPGKLGRLGPVCKRFGAPFILLPLAGRKLPVSAAERLAVLDAMLQEADDLGIPHRLIMVDALVLTVSSKPQAARACLEVIRRCSELGLATTCGLSNVSFGLPARELLNATFLTLCMGAGLTSAIANPGSTRLNEALAAGEVLLQRDPAAERFIASYATWTPGAGSGSNGAPSGTSGETPGVPAKKGPGRVTDLRQAVILGAKDEIVDLVEAELAAGADPFALVDERLIPGIMEVGEKYERREYFLPQLMLAAEAMQRAFARLEPLLLADASRAEPVPVVMATVEGDIHDIGKNIVCLMLRNHGFAVVDLGKDVPAQRIVDAAAEHGARLIGLSALMTTTMVRMTEVVELVRERGLDARVMVGGAVLSQEYAQRIGADGYAADAVSAVRLAKELCAAPVR